VWAGSYIAGGVCFLLVFNRSANAAMLGQDAVTGIMPVIALTTLDGLWLWFKYGRGSGSSEYL
jgi:hypothetical protein